jgi:cysteine desulfurase
MIKLLNSTKNFPKLTKKSNFHYNFAKLSEDTHKAIYFDFQATTPLDPRALDKMMPYFVHDFGNPHSRTHEYGWTTEKAVEESRKVNSNFF